MTSGGLTRHAVPGEAPLEGTALPLFCLDWSSRPKLSLCPVPTAKHIHS